MKIPKRPSYERAVSKAISKNNAIWTITEHDMHLDQHNSQHIFVGKGLKKG
jgi:hypothetical protein